MFASLFMQTPGPTRADELLRFWPVLLPVALGMLAVYLLLPRVRPLPALWGAGAALAALVLAGVLWFHQEVPVVESILFYSFAGLAVIAGGLVVSLRNPVHAALSFALVV